jgi:hypothetical protein
MTSTHTSRDKRPAPALYIKPAVPMPLNRNPLSLVTPKTPSMTLPHTHIHTHIYTPPLFPSFPSSFNVRVQTMTSSHYPYSPHSPRYPTVHARSCRPGWRCVDGRSATRLPSASWCAGAWCACRRRGRIGRLVRRDRGGSLGLRDGGGVCVVGGRLMMR